MINKIYCLGTSCTAGGGFEFDCKYKHRGEIGRLDITRGDYIKNIYTEHPQTQNHYSYVGQMEILLNSMGYDNIKFRNISKQGYGNERLYRKFFELTNEDNFKGPFGNSKKETLFIFEFSDLSRKEFWFEPLQNHIVMNYKADDSDLKSMTVAKSYWYDGVHERNTIKEHMDVIRKFREEFIVTDNQSIEITRNFILFLDFLKQQKFNFLISAMPETLHPNYYNQIDRYKDNIIQFGFDDDKKYESFNIFADENKLTIRDETFGAYGDLHPSLYANKLVSKMVYNKMVMNNLIKGKKISLPKPKSFVEEFKKNTKSILI